MSEAIVLSAEQVAILDHTVHSAANGMYCGGSSEMQALCELGLMSSAGKASFCPDEYFRITGDGLRVLRSYK